MKYAFIAMIAIYLITYGCSSDEPKKVTKPAKKVETITVENSQPAAPAIAVEQPAQPAGTPPPAVLPAAPTGPQTGEQPATQLQPENVAAAAEPQAAPEQPQLEQQQQPMEQDMLFVNPEDLVVMPCGRVLVKHQMPCYMPCMHMPQQEDSMAQEEPAMPQMMPHEPIMPEMMTEQPQPQTPPHAQRDELTTAMRKMVEATNEMVMVTRQMVIATEEMLNATKGAAGEIIDTGKDIPEAEKPEASEQPADPAVPAVPVNPAEQPQARIPTPQESVVESMKDVVAATKEVIEVTNEAISKAVEHQHQQ